MLRECHEAPWFNVGPRPKTTETLQHDLGFSERTWRPPQLPEFVDWSDVKVVVSVSSHPSSPRTKPARHRQSLHGQTGLGFVRPPRFWPQTRSLSANFRSLESHCCFAEAAPVNSGQAARRSRRAQCWHTEVTYEVTQENPGLLNPSVI
ncbi:hypothetical protein NOR_02325 [Metarhizium rileyi]|uniref:Uncharacterized protein n=1 Tax=Metarhizium rileyi (strain RCEF 4871) TaxID=1649241 RepID=A0A167HEX7_METRR|nr:hypothetical protein NOR_02325 [Metarhizium rileyi RCEF 4871]